MGKFRHKVKPLFKAPVRELTAEDVARELDGKSPKEVAAAVQKALNAAIKQQPYRNPSKSKDLIVIDNAQL